MTETREIQWPGRQINDVNEFRDKCYAQCYRKEPVGSDWYNKSDGCGIACKRALEEYIYSQGKNPCVLKLSPPVFWHASDMSEETDKRQVREGYRESLRIKPLLFDGVKPLGCMDMSMLLQILLFIALFILSFMLFTVLYYVYITRL